MVQKSSLVAIFCAMLLSAGQTTFASPLGKRSPHGGGHHDRPDCDGPDGDRNDWGYGPPGGPKTSDVDPSGSVPHQVTTARITDAGATKTGSLSPAQATQNSSVPAASGGVLSRSAGGMAGLGINGESGTVENIKAFLGKSVGWFYSWSAHDVRAAQLGIEYVPMLWGKDTTNIGSKDWEKWDVKTVFSFNEPDGKVGGGSAVDAKEAARLHHDFLNDLKYDIGAPGTIQGPGSVDNPVGDFWFSQWEAECAKLDGGCRYEIAPFHWYGLDAKAFDRDLTAFVNGRGKGKRVWVTEWACIQYGDNGRREYCSATEAQDFMTQTIKSIKSHPSVERYAWSGAHVTMPTDPNRNGAMQGPQMMNPDGSLNALGQLYKSL